MADGFVESWVSWREACEEVRGSYAHWGECETPRRGLAFACHLAALAREEEAARIHSDWAQRLGTLERETREWS